MKVGVARVDITPPVGHIIHSGDKVSEGVGDPLYAKALVFDGGERQAALLSADLILLEDEVISEVRHRIAERTSIPAANVLFAASHTHCGPPTTPWLSAQMSAEYLADLREKLSTVVVEAWRAPRPARLGAGMGEAKVTVNRWVETPEGARWRVNWDGPTDPSVNVLRVDDTDGKPFAAMVNFASHATVVNFGTNRLYTGDYPSHLQAALERAYPEVTALFTNGAAGDLKIAFANEEGTGFAYGGLEDARRYGAMIGAEAARVMAATTTRPVEDIGMTSRWVDLPLQSAPSAEELRRELEQPEYEFWSERWANEMLNTLRQGPLPRCVRAEVQVLRLGDVATFIALPGEAFVEIGLHLKRLFVRQPTPFVVAYANGYCGYLPSARSVQYDGTHPRYNWHKIVGYPALYTEEVEDVLVAAARKVVESTEPLG